MEIESDSASRMDSGIRPNTNENHWKCAVCSVSNETSRKRCQNCGKLRHSLSSIRSVSIDDGEISNERIYDEASTPSKNQKYYY